MAYGLTRWVVVQGGICMGPNVRRESDGTDIDWAIGRNLRRPIQLERRIAGENRTANINGWGNIPNLFHEAQR